MEKIKEILDVIDELISSNENLEKDAIEKSDYSKATGLANQTIAYLKVKRLIIDKL